MMKLKSLKNQREGFTLIELILYMGILSTLLIVFMQLFAAILDTQTESRSASHIQQDEQFLLSRITYDIHRAKSVITPAIPGDSVSSLELIIDGNTYIYQIIDNNLVLSNNAGLHPLNYFQTQVSNFIIKRIGNGTTPDTLQISFTITDKGTGKETRSVSSTIGLRNL